MPLHSLEEHKNCERPHCPICDGALASCTVCGGAEGSLPTDCPGHRMTAQQMEAVYAAALDFRDDEGWVNKPSETWQPITRTKPDGPRP